MHIAIIAADPALAQAVLAECAARGMEAVSLSPADAVSAETLKAYDAVVDAGGDAALTLRLADALKGRPAARLITVGSAGDLYYDGSRTQKVSEALPAYAADGGETLRRLKESGAAWTCFLPPLHFGAEERKTGAYVLGREIRILNSMGESRMSYADFAAALCDELAQPRFCGKCFTAISDTSACPPEPDNNLINLNIKYMLTRRGSYFGIASDVTTRGTGTAYQKVKLYIATRRGTCNGYAVDGNDLVFLTPLYQGEEVGCAVRMTPTELILTTPYGRIFACMADTHLLLIRGENGLSLALHNRMRRGEVMKTRAGAAWEGVFRWRCSLVVNPLQGALDMQTNWSNAMMTTPSFRGVVSPGADGKFLVAIDESPYAGKVREQYPSYEEGLADVKRDWEHFLSCIPPVEPALERGRIEAAWNLWGFLVDPFGFVHRPHMFMAATTVASSWQMAHNAAALGNNMPLAMDLMENMIDTIGKYGQFPDFVSDGRRAAQGIHPPVQGWAMQWLMREHDLAKECDHAQLGRIYDGLIRWADWFMLARDGDGDGIPSYDNGDECGFDDCSPYDGKLDIMTPDLPAYIIQIYDTLSDLARILGKTDEVDAWREKGDALTKKLIDTLWNGERFIAREDYTFEPIVTDSIIFYVPLILGKRLPQEIIDKMTADLLVEGDYLTPNGLCVEKLDSDFFRLAGFARGWNLPPSNIEILTGMYAAGKTEEAKMIARRYCEASVKWGMSLLLDPVQGSPTGFACSWPACTFLVLANMVCNM